MKRITRLKADDSEYLNYLKGIAITGIVLGHLGGWLFRPYTSFINATVPLFFFLSGSVAIFSYNSTNNLIYYYFKRIIKLLVPYYIICLFALIVYVVLNRDLPNFEIEKLRLWLMIIPREKMMPFPLGQVWFLNTLLIISILSPVYFTARNKPLFLICIFTFIILLSFVQQSKDIHKLFYFYGLNFYKPIIHSAFYIYGLAYWTMPEVQNKRWLALLFVIGIFYSTIVVAFFKINPDYSYHAYSPDLYYLSGCLSFITIFLILKRHFYKIINRIKILKLYCAFMGKHTFAVFLIHSFAIYFSEKVFGLYHPDTPTVFYAIKKLVIVFGISCVMAPFFTYISGKINDMLLNPIKNILYREVFISR